MTCIHVVCSARNAGRWLGELVESLVAQTHTGWVLSIRDDGSTDDTWDVVETWRRREPRIVRTIRGTESLGTALGFGQLLAALPQDAEVVATADADDVWLPHKLERSLRALEAQPDRDTVPILVHTDLRAVDGQLHEIAPSFWRHSGLRPFETSLRLVAIQNVAVGPTHLFNAALLRHLREIPPEATCQDWWISLVATALGRTVAVDEPTVLYRRHGGNHSAIPATGIARIRQLVRVLRDSTARRQLDDAALQAAALLRVHGDRLQPAARQELQRFAEIASLRGVARRMAILRWRWHPGHSVVRNLGMVVRG